MLFMQMILQEIMRCSDEKNQHVLVVHRGQFNVLMHTEPSPVFCCLPNKHNPRHIVSGVLSYLTISAGEDYKFVQTFPQLLTPHLKLQLRQTEIRKSRSLIL